MQIVDVTVTYTEEEKEAFNREFEARNKMEDAENEMILIGKEWNNHVKGNHTDIYSPVGFSALAFIFWFVTVFFFTQGFFSFFAFVTASPIFACAATGVAIYFWIRFSKQNKVYKEKEEELDKKRDRLFREYQKCKEDHAEKLKEVEAIVYRKAVEKRDAEEECLKNNKFEELFHDTEKKDE